MRLGLVLLLLIGACAHAPVAAPVPAPPPPLQKPDEHAAQKSEEPEAAEAESGAESPHRHGAKGAHAPVALPRTVVDGETGTAVADATLDAKLKAARAIYVGEEHPNPHHHAVEVEVLERAYAADPSVGLGLEMLPRTLQGPLDAFVSGAIDEAKFLEQVDWEKVWGFDFGFYRPLLEFCRAHHLRAYALNAPRSVVHTVAMKGLDALPPSEKYALPELKPGPEAHRELVREAFAQHPHGKFADADFEKFYLAQVIWDETMADRIAAALAAPGAPRRLVVVAGEGHARRFAIPLRAERRGVRPSLIIFAALDDEADDAVKAKVADLIWVLHTR